MYVLCEVSGLKMRDEVVNRGAIWLETHIVDKWVLDVLMRAK